MKLVKMKLSELIPYENNPRMNDDAVDGVAESIKQCTYTSPIIVDENNVILAGHTRLKALEKLHAKEVEVLIKEGLTEEQKKKFRLLDNKTNEFADWDFEKLDEELKGLDFEGFDFKFEGSNVDWDNVEDLGNDTYEAPEHDMLECPNCHHIDRKIHFKSVSSPALPEDEL